MLRIAIPNKGTLSRPAAEMLREAGYATRSDAKQLVLQDPSGSLNPRHTVYDAVDWFQRQVGGPNGRSGYREALEANHIVERARRGVATLIGADQPSHVLFGCSGTDVLNLAILGTVRPGDHVVTTVCDHNSVLRPLRALHEQHVLPRSHADRGEDGAPRPRPDDGHPDLGRTRHGGSVGRRNRWARRPSP